MAQKRERAVFRTAFPLPLCETPRSFAKTGSGQTRGKLNKKRKRGVFRTTIGVIAVVEGGEILVCAKRNALSRSTFLLFSAVYIEMRSFYQDRLGTNIGTALKKTTVCNIPCVSPKLVLANKRLSSRYSNTATTKTNGPFFLAPSLCTRALCRLRRRRRTRRHRWRLSFWRRCAKTQRPPGWSWRQWSPSLRPAARRLLRSYRWGRRLPTDTHKQDDHSGNVPENKNMQKEGSARPRQSEEKPRLPQISFIAAYSARVPAH